jgi:hypothetical protein
MALSRAHSAGVAHYRFLGSHDVWTIQTNSDRRTRYLPGERRAARLCGVLLDEVVSEER